MANKQDVLNKVVYDMQQDRGFEIIFKEDKAFIGMEGLVNHFKVYGQKSTITKNEKAAADMVVKKLKELQDKNIAPMFYAGQCVEYIGGQLPGELPALEYKKIYTIFQTCDGLYDGVFLPAICLVEFPGESPDKMPAFRPYLFKKAINTETKLVSMAPKKK